ncbi:unnamed protein product [Pedinophyceae sp. YPF-701]|nr:unnamed protein product [Pedinophyceae sp. YPF-701]
MAPSERSGAGEPSERIGAGPWLLLIGLLLAGISLPVLQYLYVAFNALDDPGSPFAGSTGVALQRIATHAGIFLLGAAFGAVAVVLAAFTLLKSIVSPRKSARNQAVEPQSSASGVDEDSAVAKQAALGEPPEPQPPHGLGMQYNPKSQRRVVYNELHRGGWMRGWVWIMMAADYDGQFPKEWPPNCGPGGLATAWFATLGPDRTLVLSGNADGSGRCVFVLNPPVPPRPSFSSPAPGRPRPPGGSRTRCLRGDAT